MIIDPKSYTDNELVKLVQNQKDSQALEELTNRHSGVYVAVAQKYSGFSDKIQLEEIKDDKQYNIYQFILQYKDDKNTKLSTFIGQMTRYMCLDLLSDTPIKTEITSLNEPSSEENITQNTTDNDSIEQIKMQVHKVSDPRFWKIFEMRHLGNKTKTWREIAKELDVTHEWARQIYKRYIKRIKYLSK